MSAKRHIAVPVAATLQDDLEFLILGPASPPARLHHFQPFDLGTAPITVHKDSSQHRASFGKAAVTGCVRFTDKLKRWCGPLCPCIEPAFARWR